MSVDIIGLSKLSEDELFIRLGETTTKGALFSDLAERGRALFKNTMKNIGEKLCRDERVIALYEKRGSISMVDYIAGMADIISGYVIGISPHVLALLMVKGNIDKICGKYWSVDNDGKSI